jgi:hypothetical protein
MLRVMEGIEGMEIPSVGDPDQECGEVGRRPDGHDLAGGDHLDPSDHLAPRCRGGDDGQQQGDRAT